MAYQLYVDNDNLVSLTGLFDRIQKQYVNAATVTATILDQNNSPVTGITLPITLVYLPGSNGDYYGTLGNALAITNGTTYRGVITATSGTGEAQWIIPIQAVNRINQ